jgi:hypothetical protein
VSAVLITKLIEAGTPAELVAEVAMELARAQAAADILLQRRAKDRERKRTPRNSTESEEIAESAEFHEKLPTDESPPAPPLPTNLQKAPLSPPKSKQGEVPEWMPSDEWEAFKEMRRKMRGIPFTQTAERTVIGKIGKLKAEGHDPAKLLSKAVERGHRTVFEDETTKARGGGKVELTAQQLRERAEWYVRHGQQDRAEECRQKAIAKEQMATAAGARC